MSEALNSEAIVDFLLDAPMFGDLSEEELSKMIGIMEVQPMKEGDSIFAEGDPGDAWYIVYDGEVEVVKVSGGRSRVIAVLGRRACFGEMAILDGSPRSASVNATMPGVVFKFRRAEFAKLLRQSTLAAYKLVHQMALVLVSRQRRTTSRLVGLLRTSDAATRDEIKPIVDQSSVAE